MTDKSKSNRKSPSTDDYRISPEHHSDTLETPDLPYRPPVPVSYRPAIGLIGCGGIAATHLDAYRNAGFNVVALHDRHDDRMSKLKTNFFPNATLCNSVGELLALPNLDIVDVTPHPLDRLPIVKQALLADKHVLSQKPFATDLADARPLIQLADSRGLKLAVNQNGRWAGHVSYARQAIAAGLIGTVSSIDLSVHWNHDWCAGTRFDEIKHLLLFDFAIHWFDMINCFMAGRSPRTVAANLMRAPHQAARPPLLGQVMLEYEDAQASLVFRGSVPHGSLDKTVIVGSRGMIVCGGPNLNEQQLEIHTPQGVIRPHLETVWFNDGFAGTMGELICAIEVDREPYHSARDNLRTLEMCFAAIASSESNRSEIVGSVTRLDPSWMNASD